MILYKIINKENDKLTAFEEYITYDDIFSYSNSLLDKFKYKTI